MVHSGYISEVIHVKNMVSRSCIILLREKLEDAGIIVQDIKLGLIHVSYNTETVKHKTIEEILEKYGFGIIIEREKIVLEKIKNAVIELIHQMNNVDSMVRKSDYLVEKIGLSYQSISKLFSKYENITLEKYILLNKIERIKHLIDENEFTMSEIAYMMDYSSIQHLSSQFKKITGITLGEYRNSDRTDKKTLDNII